MSQQVTKEKYSIETLRERNVSYDHQHWLTQKDVDMANSRVKLIERTRSENTPQIGDRIIYVDKHGQYYGNALIEAKDKKSFPSAEIHISRSFGSRTIVSGWMSVAVPSIL